MRSLLILYAAGLAMPGFAVHAQQPAPQSMGAVATQDALVTGGLEVRGERVSLLSNSSITAYDRTAPIDLERGGQALVCATSQLHLLHSGTGPSLLFALDRGAFELHGASQPQDVLITPDLRFTLAAPGQFDLRIRVASDGDTCVNNAGGGAPSLQIADAFSDASYLLTPGQHVLFEHGSLREVVDSESSSCGCPALLSPQVVAAVPGEPTTPTLAAAQNPFPTAVSEGLAPAQPVVDNSAPAGEKHTQISSTLIYGGNQPDSTVVPSPLRPSTAAIPAQPPPGTHDLAHLIGHFFHKLFHRKSRAAAAHHTTTLQS